MRRYPSKKLSDSKFCYVGPYQTIFPVLFWKKCFCCNHDIRFEKMWQAVTYPSRYTGWKYICFRCIPSDTTPEEVDKIFKATVHPRPMLPPPGFKPTPPPNTKDPRQ